MNPNPLWSWVLFAAGAFGLFIAGQWQPWGWLLGASMQGFYITYGLVTKQYGFIASGLTFGAISILNFLKTRYPEQYADTLSWLWRRGPKDAAIKRVEIIPASGNFPPGTRIHWEETEQEGE